MKKCMLVAMAALLSVSCNSQTQDTKKSASNDSAEKIVEPPMGSWKVDKEFDDEGNLIRYDSIYSWSSNGKWDTLSPVERDSLLQSFKSKFFTNFSGFEDNGFDGVFSKDSLFSNHYFNEDFFGSDFGKDFMDLDKVRQQMLDRQRKFLEKYQSEFIKPERESENENN